MQYAISNTAPTSLSQFLDSVFNYQRVLHPIFVILCRCKLSEYKTNFIAREKKILYLSLLSNESTDRIKLTPCSLLPLVRDSLASPFSSDYNLERLSNENR
jgi:hypothetical protein